MIASQALGFALDMLFVVGALAALLAIAGTWLAMKPNIAALLDAVMLADQPCDYRYTITDHTAQAAKVIRLPIKPQQDPSLIWPVLRAAA